MGCEPSKKDYKDADSGKVKNQHSLEDVCFVREVTDEEDVRDVYEFTGPMLGSGSFATVLMVKSKASGLEYAMKKINLSPIKDNAIAMRLLNNEIDGMKTTNHPNIVRLQEVYRPTSEDMLYLVLDRLSGGNLEDLCGRKGRIEEIQAAYIVTQIVDAVRYCHDLNIAHRDLKLANCMFVDDSDAPIVKLIDFGLCMNFKDSKKSSAFVGTMTYAAPEVVMKNKRHGLECDMWSIGVMTYRLVGGNLPFIVSDAAVLAKMIKYEDPPYPDEIWGDVSVACRDFIDKCLTKNPKKRITAAEAQAHSWLHKATDGVGAPLSKGTMLSMMKFQKTTMFEKMAMELIAYSCDPSDIRHFETHFREMDKDGTGMVTLEEFKKTLQERKKAVIRDVQDANQTASASGAKAKVGALGRLDEDMIEDVFAAMDVDSCGSISINEFVAACLARKQIENSHIKAAFERLDFGTTGLITPEDVSRYVGDSISKSDIAQDMREISSREDGLVSLEDFTKCMETFVQSRNSLAPHSQRPTLDSSATL
ncbi:unnamed protein product [Ascophyllum nodosum]